MSDYCTVINQFKELPDSPIIGDTYFVCEAASFFKSTVFFIWSGDGWEILNYGGV
ncbi:hypothetical protein [Brevibacillus laterosporus]|uniref:hypothetical protein n=1 Tax=Brevibacillus laterosporus TaxID=1465 RepID=UPI0013C48F8E|nr:hypothetical protein [Brevibacillus laterosporus]MBM7111570.1 hypothetical protein [Brevibacillus laterosporus]